MHTTPTASTPGWDIASKPRISVSEAFSTFDSEFFENDENLVIEGCTNCRNAGGIIVVGVGIIGGGESSRSKVASRVEGNSSVAF